MKKLIVVCVTLLIVLTAGIGGDVFAKSKHVYEYTLKAMRANIFRGNAGDHTYVCIKKKRKKHGKWRTVRNYGCYAKTGNGRSAGGSTRARYRVVRDYASKQGKKGALCTQKKRACRVYMGWNGTCHQESNRSLYGAFRRVDMSNVYGDREGINTYRFFGKYGHGWTHCYNTCYWR